jgi:hypothetical protein
MDVVELDRRREQLKTQMWTRELAVVAAAIHAPTSLLVFGVGNDSPLWMELNPGGRTAFLEDDPTWFAQVTAAHPALEGHLVQYGTRRTQWRALLHSPDQLRMALPAPILEHRWDVVLVDGPAGHRDFTVGRMKSLYMAAQLVKPGGSVFVHDAEREVETAYAQQYLAGFSLVHEVRGRAVLRHYRDDGLRGGLRDRVWRARSALGTLQRRVERRIFGKKAPV